MLRILGVVACCLLVVGCGCVMCLKFVVRGFMFVVRSSPLLFAVVVFDVRWRSLFAVCW